MERLIKINITGGHGGGPQHNRGALCYNEGDNNYLYSVVLKSELEKYEGVIIDLGRKNINDNPNLEERAASGKGYDLYLAIHSNAIPGNPTVRGTEVWDSVEKPNKVLAKAICDVTAELFQHNNRGVKYREGQPGWNYYGELRKNGAKSAMILEIGFHTNKEDCSFFKNNHKKIAEVQAYAIANHYGLKRKGSDIPAWQRQMEAEWKKAIELGITDGSNPNGIPTRGQVVSMIVRAMGGVN